MKGDILRLYALWATLLVCATMTGQQLREVSGVVRDAQTGHRLAAVSVSADRGGAGTVTNDEGEFVIKVPHETTTLSFRHLGYATERALPTGGTVKVKMRPEAIMLSEIVVGSPLDLLRAAIKKIPQNYPAQPNLMRCFYRETTRRGHRYIYVAEAVAELYKSAYTQGIAADRVAIVKGRRLVSPKQTDTLGAKIQGGPTMPIYCDVVKNRDYLLSEQEMALYSFAMELPTHIDGRPQIVISFHPNSVMPYALFTGRYFIDRESLSLTRMEISLDTSDRQKATAFMLHSKPAGVRFKPRELIIEVNYRTENGCTRMSYVRNSFQFKCDWKRRLFSSPYTVVSEMVVTSVDSTDARPIRGRNSFSSHDSYYDHKEYFRDDAFWGDYNIIAPTERLENAINKLVKKNE